MRSLRLLLLLLIGSSCKTWQETSQLRHEKGDTFVAPASALQSCDQSIYDSPPEKYLYDVMTYVMQHNPATFLKNPQTKVYAPEHFCITTDVGNTINGGASKKRRLIKISLGTLRLAKNDAQVASIISHELAHITRQHAKYMLKKDIELQEILGTVAFKNQLSELEGLQKKILDQSKVQLGDLQKLFEAELGLEEERGRAQKKTEAQREQANRKMEQNADEVGFEFFLNAKLDPLHFVWGFRDSDLAEVAKCRKQIEDYEISQICLGNKQYQNFHRHNLSEGECKNFLKLHPDVEEPKYPSPLGTHPSPCYREYNIISREWNNHREDYRDLLKDADRLIIVDPSKDYSLQKLQAGKL